MDCRQLRQKMRRDQRRIKPCALFPERVWRTAIAFAVLHILIRAGRLCARLRDPGDGHINVGNFKPGGVVHDARDRQVENPLERLHRIGGLAAVDAVRCDPRNGGVIPGDAV